ncbi:hypothetical protein R82265_HNDDMDAM_00098 [Fructobacillus cardui]|uniref:hypothetical protein n=1 Tax=Fructobacillus cardui TaxID=2893170 RepID=UPI002D93EF85|nr:hypothetical protein R82265_HNDDMDAM_00098 [Fructobacillus cardui]
MTKKFTEEQYRAIAKAGDKAANEVYGLIDSRVDYEELLRMEAPNQDNDFYSEFTLYNQQIMAIANPLTRDWAHEQFVEKERKYIWQLKPLFDDDDEIYLKEYENGIISYTINSNHASPLTESKVREWGYNPDMFNRERVE